MRRVLFFIFVLILALPQTYGFELVLPKERKTVTTYDYALFAGKARNIENISINGEKIRLVSNGAFAHSVRLNEGENKIVVKSRYGLQMFKIYKSLAASSFLPTEDMPPTKGYVNSDNTPLRSSPEDAGLNRISHLFGGTHLVINGSQGSFYRVVLAKNKVAWIAKNDVTLTDEELCPADFTDMSSERFKNAMIQSITFSKKLPYSIEDTKKEIIFRVYNPELSEESVYNVNIPKPKKYAYTVNLEDGKYTFKVRKLPDIINDTTVIIDAGHGGQEKGAIGCLGDEEKIINLKIAHKTAELLKKRGFKVVLTRDCDTDLGLQERVDIARENDADIFISIHLNSIGNAPMNINQTRGTSVYYYNDNSKAIAEYVKKAVVKSAKTRDDGIRTASFAVIRPSEYISLLVETAYMTNPLDTLLYRDSKWIDKVAKGIANGIETFVNK